MAFRSYPAKRSSANGKHRDAIERSIRGVIESLEGRVLLTVTMDSNGWTQVTPTPGVSRLIYVSSSTGSDTNNGLSPAAPLATIAHAVSLVRNDEPDWILLMRGDTFDEDVILYASGLSAQQPMVFTDYGNPALPRPVIDGMAGTALHTGYSNSFVDVIGISFTSSTADPTSPNFNGNGSDGLSDGGTSNLLVEDCSFSYFIDDVLLETVSAPISNVTVRRCEILDSYCTTGHSEGLYGNGVAGLTLEENTFDHDGWNASISGAGATGYNHDCYLASNNSNCVIVDNVFADAGSCGLQARSGGIVDDNLFIGDPYGFTFGLVNGATTTPGGVSGQVIGNVVIEPRVDNVNTWGIAMQIGNLQVGGGTVIADNIVADAPSEDTPAIEFAPGNGDANPQAAAGLNTLVFSNNVVYDWGYAMYMSSQYVDGTSGPDGLTGVVIRDNDFQQNVAGRIIDSANVDNPLDESWSGNIYSSTATASSSWFEVGTTTTSLATWQSTIEPTAISETVPFVNPTATIESYMGSQGLAATMAAFVAGARSLSSTNWNPVYQASAVLSYIQGGFSVNSSAPVATLTAPPDVTPSNYLTTPSPTFTITYTDAVAVNPATIRSANVTITGAGGVTLPVSLVSTSGSGASITATYEVSAPGGDWMTVPYGTYVISVAGGQVMDTSGNTVAGEPLGTFQVTVNSDPITQTAAATTPANFTAVAGSTSINLSWSDPAGDQESYILQRAFDSNFTQSVQNFPLTSDATSYTDSAIVVGDTYYYQLIAVNPLGNSAPTPAVFATVLPPPPELSDVILDDGNHSRTAITSATLVFTSPVTVNSGVISLVQNPQTNPTPVATVVSNPSGDGETWLVSWTTPVYNNALPDGSYSLTVHGASIADEYGQTAGGDQTTNFTSADGPVVTAAVYNHSAPPHSLAFTFSTDVSASLAAAPLSAITLTNSAKVVIPAAGYSWNPATLTATWTFSGALPDGSYSAKLSAAAITNADGVHLDGNGDGIPGDSYVYSFTQVAPTLTASGASNVNVNAPYTLTLGAITDAGQTSPQYLVHWGDGSTSTYTSSGKVTHTYTTALGPTKISIDVLDANGTHAGVASVSVSINRATIALTGNSNANYGANYTLNLGAVTDPGFTVSQYIVHWGDGATSTYTTAGAQTHPFKNTTGSPVSDTITVDLVDNSGSGGANFTNLSVAALKITLNPAPYIPVTGSLNANAGGTYQLTVGAPSDPGFTVSQLLVNWGDGSPSTPLAAGGGSLTHTFKNATAPNSDSITVDMTDNSGTYKSAGHLTIVVNPAPTVALSGNSAANIEGAYELNVAPAVDTAQTVSQYTINWGDGSTPTVSSSPGNFNHVYTSTGPATITVDVTDGTGVYPAAGSLPITVNNDPTIALSGNPYANAGGSYTLNLGAVNDPGQSVSQYTVHWGDGTAPGVYTAGGAVTHTYSATGPDTIRVDLTDGTGTYDGVGSLPVSVTRPTIGLSGNAGVFQGQSYSVTLNPPSDFGGTPQQYIVNWGDGTSSIYMNTGIVDHIFAQHVYSVAQNVIVTADLVDNTGTFLEAGSLPLTVAPPPTVNVLGSANTNVGGVYTLTLGGVTDSIGTVSSFIVHWGDNTSSTTSTLGNITHVYNSAGPATIVIDTVDQNGTFAGAANLALTVNKPTITLAGNPYAPLNKPYTLQLGSVFDPGQTVTGYTVHWGDGSSSTYGVAGLVQHTYSTPGNVTLSVDITDGIGTYVGAATLPVAVAVAPTLTLSGSGHANAGGTYTLGLGPVSDSNGTPTQYLVHWGDGDTNTYSTLGLVTHTYTMASDANISVDVTDPDGVWVNSASMPVIVNPTPTISLSGNTRANTGGVYTLNLGAVTDPGYTVSQYTVYWGDGKFNSYAAGGAVTHTFAASGPDDITISLTDPTGTFAGAGSYAVTINPAPTLALSGNTTANAGAIYTLNLGAVTDPGYAVSQYTVHWGDGKMNSYTAGGAVTHTFGAPGPAHITVDLTDPTGTFTSAGSYPITVVSAPSISLSGNTQANVGGIYTLNLGAVTDPGNVVSKYTVHWGDSLTSSYSTGGAVTHAFTKAGPADITVDLTDATGTYSAVAAYAITVNPAPTLALSGSTTANLGGIYTLTLGTVTDPGYAVSKYTVHWGDGLSNTYSAGGAVTHTFAKAGPANITVDLTDPTGTFTTAGSRAVTVNPAPTLALAGASAVTVNTVYSLTLGAVTDPGYTVSQYTVHWGDGTTGTYSAGGVVTHTYTAAISAAITVDLKDSTGTYTHAGALNLTVSPASLFSSSIDIGSPKLAGSASSSNGTYTVTGEGSDIYNTSDQFHYDYTNVTGNTTISAKVTSVQNINSWSKAGVMIRNGTAANAAFADVVVTPAGYVSFQYRTKAGGAASMYTITGKTVPQYVKLVRTGNSFAAYYSSNGTTWTQIGPSVSITMSSAVTTGLAVTSLNTAKTCTATFTNVSIAA